MMNRLNMQRSCAILKKELLSFRRDPNGLIPLVLLPVVFGVAFPVAVIWMARDPQVSSHLRNLLDSVSQVRYNSGSGQANLTVVSFLLNFLTVPLFLLIPIIVATNTATVSFAGEKENKTLEGLLYTPVTNSELMLGKAAASMLLAIGLGWISLGLYLVCSCVGGFIAFGFNLVQFGRWSSVGLVLIPLVSLLSNILVMIVSQHAETVRSASSLSSLILLPIIGIFVSQLSGVFLFGAEAIAIAALVVLLLDLLGFFIVIRFDREQLLLGSVKGE